jgi:hypothetical protein
VDLIECVFPYLWVPSEHKTFSTKNTHIQHLFNQKRQIVNVFSNEIHIFNDFLTKNRHIFNIFSNKIQMFKVFSGKNTHFQHCFVRSILVISPVLCLLTNEGCECHYS